jgi:diguanylate cyclase (GGDEF)-like protein
VSSDRPIRLSLRRQAALALAFCLLYACTDIALNSFGFNAGWTIFWPLNGVTIVLLLRRPRSTWPPIMLGVAIGSGIGEFYDGNTIGALVWLRLFSITEVFLCALILPRFTSLNEWLATPRISLRLFAALLVGPGITGVLAAIFYHITIGQSYLLGFDQWAVADALGIASSIPISIAFESVEMRSLFRPRQLPSTLAVLTLAGVGVSLSLTSTRYPLLFLFFPTLLVVDILLSFAGSAIVIIAASFFAIFLATRGYGPFGNWPTTLAVSRDVALQTFLGFHLLALFPASILIMERRKMAQDLRVSNSQLLMLVSLDGLTGVANRRALDEQLDHEWKRAIRLGSPVALVMIDVDVFKQFNDLYGHQAGDECLRAVATVLSEKSRRTQDHVARFGGEEFTLLLPYTNLAGAQRLAETIRSSVFDLAIPHAGSAWGVVTISLGCAAIIPTVGTSHHTLITMADTALYAAKKSGRNCVQSTSDPVETLAAL